MARTVPFEVWKRPDELAQAIGAIAATLPPSDCAAVTMTAELCDCFPTKGVGVNAILDAVIDALSVESIVVWGLDGQFHELPEARQNPALVAAANWLALATLAARLLPEEPALLIDIGTTTTDLIPLLRGTRRRPGAERHRATPGRRARLCRRPPHAGLCPGDRAPVPRGSHRPGGRALRLHARCLPHSRRHRIQPD